MCAEIFFYVLTCWNRLLLSHEDGNHAGPHPHCLKWHSGWLSMMTRSAKGALPPPTHEVPGRERPREPHNSLTTTHVHPGCELVHPTPNWPRPCFRLCPVLGMLWGPSPTTPALEAERTKPNKQEAVFNPRHSPPPPHAEPILASSFHSALLSHLSSSSQRSLAGLLFK